MECTFFAKYLKILSCIFYSFLYYKNYPRYNIFNNITSNITNDSLNEVYNSTNLEIYRELFTLRRQQHKNIIKDVALFDGVKQGRFINIVVLQALKDIQESRAILLNASYVIVEEELPNDYEVKKSLSKILEYTLLCGDLVLYFPFITHHALRAASLSSTIKNKVQQGYKDNRIVNNFFLKWAIKISNATRLLSAKDTETLWLMSQELGYVPRDPRYINPYALENEPPNMNKDKDSRKEKKTKLKS